MRKFLPLLFLFLIFISRDTFGGTTGKLTGKVIDANTKESLPFCNISIVGTSIGTVADLDGNYVILNIPPGNYSVRAQYVGYQPVVAENISISIDLTSDLDFSLNESAVELQAVVVEGKVDAVKKDITSSQTMVSAEQISALPVTEFDDILGLQAGVTKDASGGFHIRGGRTTEI